MCYDFFVICKATNGNKIKFKQVLYMFRFKILNYNSQKKMSLRLEIRNSYF